MSSSRGMAGWHIAPHLWKTDRKGMRDGRDGETLSEEEGGGDKTKKHISFIRIVFMSFTSHQASLKWPTDRGPWEGKVEARSKPLKKERGKNKKKMDILFREQ